LGTHDTEVSGLICQNERQLEDAFLKVIRRGQERGAPAGLLIVFVE
jgi:hypothetical protein